MMVLMLGTDEWYAARTRWSGSQSSCMRTAIPPTPRSSAWYKPYCITLWAEAVLPYARVRYLTLEDVYLVRGT